MVKHGLSLPLAQPWALGWTGWPPEPSPKTSFSVSLCWLLRKVKGWKLAPTESSLCVQNNLNHSIFILSLCEMLHTRETCLSSASSYKYPVSALGAPLLLSSSVPSSRRASETHPRIRCKYQRLPFVKPKVVLREQFQGWIFSSYGWETTHSRGKKKKMRWCYQTGWVRQLTASMYLTFTSV